VKCLLFQAAQLYVQHQQSAVSQFASAKTTQQHVLVHQQPPQPSQQQQQQKQQQQKQQQQKQQQPVQAPVQSQRAATQQDAISVLPADKYGTGIKLREVRGVGLQVLRLTPGSAAALSGMVGIGDMLVGIDS